MSYSYFATLFLHLFYSNSFEIVEKTASFFKVALKSWFVKSLLHKYKLRDTAHRICLAFPFFFSFFFVLFCFVKEETNPYMGLLTSPNK